ncbi:hypothetical protein DFH08DRAFT_966514 [Mycena albidolilacea]|uniref:Uncharacterized protein n=1 Tax=Mycena albidolilacea TaxID=1033008 RepID=A0AAD7EL98_9AGAR|nr:hypothetical protein DFH08DRAFT_966514 [Mycena albidolilacea]
MSETAEASTIDSETLSSSPLLDDATSDTEVEPPSPGGSTKGLYVRSRPTSMDGSLIDFPGFAPDLDFTRFGMTPAHGATSPIVEHFPQPPTIGQPPPGKKHRYAASVKSLYTGNGTGTTLKTNRAPAAPVKTVPRDLTAVPATPVAAKPSGGAWKVLKKMVPGLFPRPTGRAAKALTPHVSNFSGTHTPPSPIAIAHTRTTSFPLASSFTRGRALSIRFFKSKGKARAVGVENLPPLPVRATSPRPRMHSFSGYLADSELADDEDETYAEMTAIQLEALGTVLKLNELFVFANVDPEETGIAL